PPSLSLGILDASQRGQIVFVYADSLSVKKKKKFLSIAKIQNITFLKDDQEELKPISQLPKCDFKMIKNLEISGCCNRISINNRHKRHLIGAFLDNSSIEIFTSKSLAHKELDRSLKKVTQVGTENEGFAISFSHHGYHLAFGDNSGNISLVDLTKKGKINSDSVQKFEGHKSSSEDIQWSPDSEYIFSSCSSDKSIKFWDTRELTCSISASDAHRCDINVISWNHYDKTLIVSGDDSGFIKVWDQRLLEAKNPKHLFKFDYHKMPITSICWNNTKENSFLCSSSDKSVTLWDLESLEIGNLPQKMPKKAEGISEELFFDHRTQNEPKEVHWLNGDGFIVTEAKGIDIVYPLE
ncbi:MAG: Glutamate-rich WD repeat-containing protein 1, partial [Paramarteilia canceri]